MPSYEFLLYLFQYSPIQNTLKPLPLHDSTAQSERSTTCTDFPYAFFVIMCNCLIFIRYIADASLVAADLFHLNIIKHKT
jgi:hypothetical protein